MSLAEDERTALGARWQRIVTLLDERELDALYVTAGPNFRWLAGGSPYPGGLPIWLSALIISAGGSGLAVISDMHAEILDLDGTGIGDVITYADGDDTSKVLGRALSAAGITAGSRLGVEENIPFADTQAIHQVSPHIRSSTVSAQSRTTSRSRCCAAPAQRSTPPTRQRATRPAPARRWPMQASRCTAR
jgi:Xaa-Pro aminopeptidase